MNCQNCGAPMELIPERSYFFCEYCRSNYFPLGTEEGVRVLDEGTDSLQCPLCQEPLSRAAFDLYRGYFCKHCQGILIDRWSFGQVVKFRRSRAIGMPVLPPPMETVELNRKIVCPHCQKLMETHPYYGPGNIVVQTCSDCDLIWLDYGELTRIIDAPGRDRSTVDQKGADRSEEVDNEESLEKNNRKKKLFPF